MKQEKTFIKRNIKSKAVTLFLAIALFCIFGILACGGDLPTSSSDNGQNNNYNGVIIGENIIDNSNYFPITDTDIPTIDKNSPIINMPTTNINPSSYPESTYRNLVHFVGSANISYKDTSSLTELWLNLISKSFALVKYDLEGGIETFKFAENGDLYWERNNNSTLIKKFHGGTVVMWKGGDYPNAYSVGGVYTYALSRDEAKSKGSKILNAYFGVNKGNDGGGKKGKVEILVFNHGYTHTIGNKKYSAHALQSYNQPANDRVSKYLGELKPEDSMPSLGYWDIYRAYSFMEEQIYVGYYY